MSLIRGVLLLDKPKGFTSHDVVARVRRIFKTKEVGHAGTLDPMAEGLLVILLGEATKLSQYLTADDKTYVAKMDLGYATDTLDAEGQEIFRARELDLSKTQIEDAAQKLVGDLRLPVPIYSAVKMNGRKLYEYARSGEAVDVPIRNMKFYSSDILDVTLETLEVRLCCEKGAYIRAWVGQLGEDLKVGATMTKLVRESSGPFLLKDGISLEALTDEAEKQGVALLSKEPDQAFESFLSHVCQQSYFIPLEKCVSGRFFRLDSFEERLMKNGQIAHSLEKRLVPCVHEVISSQTDQIIRIFSTGPQKDDLKALIHISHKSPRPKILRVFH